MKVTSFAFLLRSVTGLGARSAATGGACISVACSKDVTVTGEQARSGGTNPTLRSDFQPQPQLDNFT